MSAKKQVTKASSNIEEIIKHQTADFSPSSLKLSSKKNSKSRVSKRADQHFKKDKPALPPTDKEIQALINRVKPRGFVTETELLYLFPKLEIVASRHAIYKPHQV